MIKKIYREIRYWFFSFKEDPKYYCRYDEIVQNAYSSGHRDGMEMQEMIEEVNGYPEKKYSIKQLRQAWGAGKAASNKALHRIADKAGSL